MRVSLFRCCFRTSRICDILPCRCCAITRLLRARLLDARAWRAAVSAVEQNNADGTDGHRHTWGLVGRYCSAHLSRARTAARFPCYGSRVVCELVPLLTSSSSPHAFLHPSLAVAGLTLTDRPGPRVKALNTAPHSISIYNSPHTQQLPLAFPILCGRTGTGRR